MTTAYTSLLGLALPVTGELSGTWGDTVNNSITSLLDTSVAGTTNVSTDTDVTLTTTTGAANTARQAILLFSGARTALRTVTAPAQSKIYTVINATTGGFSVKLVGVGPTTGVTIVAGESAVCAWNGSDFVKVSNTGGSASFTNVTVTGTTTLSGLTASTALALDASKNVVSVTNTGTGNNVLAVSPTLTGTTSIATLNLTNALGTAYGGTGLTSFTSGGVVYASSSSALATGSALIFDGANLLLGNIASTGLSTGQLQVGTTSVSDSAIQMLSSTTGTSGVYFGDGTTGGDRYRGAIEYANTGDILRFYSGASAQLNLTSSSLYTASGINVGIGTSNPQRKIDAQSTTADYQLRLGYNSSFYYDIGRVNSNGYLGFYGSQTNATGFTFGGVDGTWATISSTGNLGLGVTPSAWDTSVFRTLQVGSGAGSASLSGRTDGIPNATLGVNVYYGTGAYRYIGNGTANYYNQQSGVHSWHTAASGTAGNAISFTQAMTLDASGNLAIGTTTVNSASNDVLTVGKTSNSQDVSLVVRQFGNNTAAGFYLIANDDNGAPYNNISSATSGGTTHWKLGGIGGFTGGLAISTSGSEKARIDSSGNLLVGTTSASGIITTSANVNSQAGTIYTRNINASSGSYSGLTVGNNLGPNYAGFILASSGQSSSGFLAANSVYAYAGAGQMAIVTEAAYPLIFGTGGTERARFDSSGNLLVGATTSLSPSSGRTDISVNGSSNSIISFGIGGTRQGYLYAPSTGMILASETGTLSLQTAYTDPIQFNTNGSERARIDSSGNLLVGTTTAGAGLGYATRIAVDGASSEASVFKTNAGISAYCSRMWNSATSGDNCFIAFQTEAGGTQRGSITYNRTAGLTAYNTTSDYRAKDISGPVTDSGALIDSTPVYMGKMKGATQERPMFIAHETPAYAHTGEKDAVDADGNPVYQQMDASALIPVMWAEIQSLRKRLADAGI